jgi:hypothetical protein
MYRDTPLANANVIEIDANHRYINQTYTDHSGYFTMEVSGGKTSIRVTHRGMYNFTRKIGKQKSWNISLEKKNDKDNNNNIISRYETNKLLVGISKEQTIPQLTWVEQLSDTTYCLVIPIRVTNSAESYPQDRRAIVHNYNSKIIAIGRCIEEALAEEGAPESWDPYVRTQNSINSNTMSSLTSYEEDYYCYPRFIFTKEELEYMIDHKDELSYFAVDTARGENYWMYYPHRDFAKELQKLLNRMLK